MKKVLLVIESAQFGAQIKAELQKDHEVLLCHDADTASRLIAEEPDAMVLELELPGVDGMTFLEHLPSRPSVILAVGYLYNPYVYQRLRELSVGFAVQKPCTLAAVTDRLRDMLRKRDESHGDPQAIAASHLTILGISSERGGGRFLRVGIPLYAQDQQQQITKELYPAVAKLCGVSGGTVEHAIRTSIQQAWDQRDADCWKDYFPKRRLCPSNKIFISALAERIWRDWVERNCS